MSGGLEGESLAKKLFVAAGWSLVRVSSGSKLLAIAVKVAPTRVQRALEALDEEGIDLYDMSAQDVLDVVYGIDFIVRSPITGQLIGVDATQWGVSSPTYHRKMVKAASPKLQALSSAIGLSKVIVFNPIEQPVPLVSQLVD